MSHSALLRNRFPQLGSIFFLALSFCGYLKGVDVRPEHHSFQCVLEHRNRIGGYEVTREVAEKRFYFDRNHSSGVLALGDIKASARIENEALLLNIESKLYKNSAAVAEIPVDRLQTFLKMNERGERFVLTCEKRQL